VAIPTANFLQPVVGNNEPEQNHGSRATQMQSGGLRDVGLRDLFSNGPRKKRVSCIVWMKPDQPQYDANERLREHAQRPLGSARAPRRLRRELKAN